MLVSILLGAHTNLNDDEPNGAHSRLGYALDVLLYGIGGFKKNIYI